MRLAKALLFEAALATGLPVFVEPPHLRQQGSARQPTTSSWCC